MSVNVKNYTRVIIRKNRQYLRGKEMATGNMLWDSSPYMAWYTRDVYKARNVALKVGGIAMLFNPVVGRVMVL